MDSRVSVYKVFSPETTCSTAGMFFPGLTRISNQGICFQDYFLGEYNFYFLT